MPLNVRKILILYYNLGLTHGEPWFYFKQNMHYIYGVLTIRTQEIGFKVFHISNLHFALVDFCIDFENIQKNCDRT